MSKLLLIDGNSLTYRAYYGSAYSPRGILTTSDGTPVNAVLTLNRMLTKAFAQYEPTHVLIAFDAGSKTVRHAKLDSYKGGRKKTPDELIRQFPLVKEMIEKMGIKHFELDQIEADDIIASLAVKHSDLSEVIVMSSDRDLFQLTNKNISIAVPQNGSKPNDSIVIDEFYDRFGYNPDQVKDFKGIVGDASDNLPGVKGIGEKGAIKLLGEYKTLDGIYENIENITGSIKQKLINDKEIAFICRDVATLIYDVNVPYSFEQLVFENTISNELIEFFKKYELNSLVRAYGNKIAVKQEKSAKNNKKMSEQISFDNLLF